MLYSPRFWRYFLAPSKKLLEYQRAQQVYMTNPRSKNLYLLESVSGRHIGYLMPDTPRIPHMAADSTGI